MGKILFQFFVVLTSLTISFDAFAGRYKIGSGGSCYFDSNDSGPDQCAPTQSTAPAPAPVPATPTYVDPVYADLLLSGQQLYKGQTVSAGPCTLVSQSDGNVVIYAYGRPIWALSWKTGFNWGTTSTVAMQGDGNFVVYQPAPWLFYQYQFAAYHTSTHGFPGAKLVVNRDYCHPSIMFNGRIIRNF